MYSRTLKLIFSIAFMLFGINVMGQVSITDVIEKNRSIGDLSQVTLEDGQNFLITLSYKNRPTIDLFSVNDIKKLVASVDFITNSGAIALLQPQPNSDLVFSSHTENSGDLLVHKISLDKKKVKSALLKNIGLITSVIRTSSGYLIGGTGQGITSTLKGGVPLLIELNEQLKEINRSKNSESLIGEIRVLKQYGKNKSVILNTRDESFLGNTSSSLTLKDEIKLDGYAATGLSVADDVLVAYLDKENYLWLEKFDKNKKSNWKTKILKRNGIGDSQFQIMQIKNGIALIGINEDALTVAGVTNNGQLVNTFTDKSGIGSPNGLGFVLMTDGVNINIFEDVYSYADKDNFLKRKCLKDNCEFRVHMRVNGEQLFSKK
jgi:hypothetical protein